MGIKNAAKAKIKKNIGKAPTKETVDTPMSECTAENPLECRFHGMKALEQQLGAVLPSLGYTMPFGTDKLQGGKGYEIRLNGNVDVEKNGIVDSLMEAFKNQGWNLTYNGKIEGAGHSFILKKAGKAKSKVAKSTESDNSDLVDSSIAPGTEEQDPMTGEFADDFFNLLKEDNEDVPTGKSDGTKKSGKPKEDPFEGLDDSGLTDDEVKKFLAANGITAGQSSGLAPFNEVIANWKGVIESGIAPNGSKLEDLDINMLKDFCQKAGFGDKVAKALWGKMVQKGLVEEDEKINGVRLSAKGDDFDLSDYIGDPDKLKKDTSIADIDAQVEESMGDFDDLLKVGEDNHTGAAVDEDAMKSIVDKALDSLPGYTYVSSETTGSGAVKLTLETAPDDGESLSHTQIKLKLDELLKPHGFKTGGLQSAKKGGQDILIVSPISNDGDKNADETPTWEEIKEFLGKSSLAQNPSQGWKTIVLTGKFPSGNDIDEDYKKKFNEAIAKFPSDNKVVKAIKKWMDVSSADDEPTWEEMKGFLLGGGILSPESISLAEEAAWKPMILTGKYYNGEPIDDSWKEKFSAAIAKLPSDNKMAKAIKKWMDVDSAKDATKELKLQDFIDWAKKNFPKSSVGSDTFGEKLKELADTGMWFGGKLSLSQVNDAIKSYTEKDPDSPVTKALVAKLKEQKGEIESKFKMPAADLEKLPPKTSNPSPETSASKEKPSEKAPDAIGEIDESLMKPLEHDESKFPPKLTQKELDAAIAKGKEAGGHGGLHTTIVEIGGKKYICKNGAGKKSKIIKNGFNADMAYRAGGVYAPDAKLYEFGDGKTYKLSEFVEGQKLIDVWKGASEAKREEIRKELLKGYPLDALFSNYDVLGTSPEESQTVTITGADGTPQNTHVAFDNIIIGEDGHAYRIDNDGAFAMTGTGGHKSSSGGSYAVPVEAEQWDNWDERQWIDDFRTMRRNEKNLGIFDRYTTADIFLAAGNVNLDNAVSSLPKQLQKAMAKPLFEMKQMTYRAVNIALGGYKNNEFVSMALDASYEASKKGLREQCQLAVSWNNSGFGKYKEHWGNYQPQPFGEKPPEPPQDPTQVLNSKLKNEEYTGGKIGTIILNAAKTINHHGGVKQTDKDGHVLGNGTAMSSPDYDPNAAKIAEWEKIDREKLAELAKTDDNAKTLLGLYDTIAYSQENGWKKPIGQIPTGLVINSSLDADFKSAAEKKILEDMEGAIQEFNEKQKTYQKELIAYEKRKSEHKKKEEAKALAAGGSPYHNFHHFADALMEEGINTDGVAHKVKTNGIKPIESSMHSQKASSYDDDAVKWKVREMMALGYSPQQVLDMAETGKLYNGSYYIDCINSSLLPNKESWARDMNSQAMYLGLNMLKMENEHNDLYDKQSGVVFLNRNIGNVPEGISPAEKAIYDSSTKTGWIGPHVDSAADCMQFEKNSWDGAKKQVYAVPFSRVVCCANNESATGGGYGYDCEQEYVGNLYQLPCWVYHPENNLTWKNAIDKAKESKGMTALLKKFATRLAGFNTLE